MYTSILVCNRLATNVLLGMDEIDHASRVPQLIINYACTHTDTYMCTQYTHSHTMSCNYPTHTYYNISSYRVLIIIKLNIMCVLVAISIMICLETHRNSSTVKVVPEAKHTEMHGAYIHEIYTLLKTQMHL